MKEFWKEYRRMKKQMEKRDAKRFGLVTSVRRQAKKQEREEA